MSTEIEQKNVYHCHRGRFIFQHAGVKRKNQQWKADTGSSVSVDFFVTQK
jgi:hypothetical protein